MPATIVSIYGPRSGVGKTIFAANFAYTLARIKKNKVLLVDLDTHDCGDLALLLGISSPRTLSDLSDIAASLTPEHLESEVSSVSDLVKILPAVRNVRKIPTLEADKVAKILGVCAQTYPWIVIDCGSELTPITVKAFEVSSSILFVTTPEILTLQRSTHSLAELQALAFPSQQIHLVLNRFVPARAISESMVSQKLKKNCVGILPEAQEGIEHSVHQGIPIAASQPRAPYSQSIETLLRALFSAGHLKSQAKQDLKEISARATQTVVSQAGQQRIYATPEEDEIRREQEIKLKIHQRLIELLDFRKLSADELTKQDDRSLDELRTKANEVILSIVDQMPEIASRETRQRITKEVLNEALGLGPLEELLADNDVNEILVNRIDQVYVERKGKLVLTNSRFTSDKYLLGVIERIVAPIGRRIDEKTPMVDARLKDGSRVHAIIPPLALDGPMITIRKFSRGIFKADQLAKLGTMTDEMADFFRACIQLRLNIVISGGTGSGKTTLLNVLAGFISDSERIVTVEDSAELRLPQKHVGRLEARPPNLQGEGAIPIRELVRNTLRMRPDRIIVGECRGAEALDMLQAMNTGHDGSMTTLHANTPRDCVSRLETLVMFSGLDLPSRAIREQIASAIQLIIQLTRLSDGTRKITAVTEVTGMEGNNVQLQDLFLYKQKGIDADGKVMGAFTSTGLIPTFAELFKSRGIALPKGLFQKEKE